MALYQNIEVYLFLSVLLLACGVAGLVFRRTLIGMLISVELILNGAGLNLMTLNRFVAPEGASGQVFTLFVMGVAASEAAVALGIIILLFRRLRRIEGDTLRELRG